MAAPVDIPDDDFLFSASVGLGGIVLDADGLPPVETCAEAAG
jgi:hypothetical protein